jgi:hypothetical protein
MSIQIEDGGGVNGKIKGDANQRLLVNATTETYADQAAEVGDKYNINTGYVTVTASNECALLHIKNNETDPLVLTALIYSFGSSNGSGTIQVNVFRNPTSGTIVTNANNVSANSNMNFGSNKTLSITAFAGSSTHTTTGGVLSIASLVNNNSRNVISLGAVVIPKGSSLSVSVKPGDGNTSMNTNIAAAAYLLTDKVNGGIDL